MPVLMLHCSYRWWWFSMCWGCFCLFILIKGVIGFNYDSISQISLYNLEVDMFVNKSNQSNGSSKACLTELGYAVLPNLQLIALYFTSSSSRTKANRQHEQMLWAVLIFHTNKMVAIRTRCEGLKGHDLK